MSRAMAEEKSSSSRLLDVIMSPKKKSGKSRNMVGKGVKIDREEIRSRRVGKTSCSCENMTT